jgi:hypothetical protein
MRLDRKSVLDEFAQEVVNSHVLVIAELMAGETPSAEVLLQLAAEVLTIDKLAVMIGRQVTTIAASHDCWQTACECFETSHELWSRLPHDDLLAGHRRLLERLVCSAQERCEFYSVSDHDRAAFNAQRDHGLPIEDSQADGTPEYHRQLASSTAPLERV